MEHTINKSNGWFSFFPWTYLEGVLIIFEFLYVFPLRVLVSIVDPGPSDCTIRQALECG
jgi:hypothetical protein